MYNDWRGYLIALFALVWIANQYMSIYAHLRLDIRKDRVEIKHVEKKVEEWKIGRRLDSFIPTLSLPEGRESLS